MATGKNYGSLMNFSLPVIENPVITQGKQQRALMMHLMSGEATFLALKKAVDDLVKSAPENHDIIVHAFNIYIDKIGFIEPHSLLLSGFDDQRNHTSVVAHYTQIVARVIYIKKKEPDRERTITGFWVGSEKSHTA